MEGGRLEGEGALTSSTTEAYIFDFDGTLGTIPVDWEGVKESLRRVTDETSDFKQIFATLDELIAKSPRLAGPAFAVLDEFEEAAAPSARLYDGSKALLSRLAERAKVALVTMQGRVICSQILEKFELKQYFIRYITREDSLDRAEQLEFALAAMRVERASAMFVGDRLNDLNAAKKVRIPFTMIRTHGEDPSEAVPIFHSLAEFSESLP
jgi:HAD superfamily hydrolase (TIGR01549 family)